MAAAERKNGNGTKEQQNGKTERWKLGVMG